VALKPDPRVFQDESWPEEIRQEAAGKKNKPDNHLAEGFRQAHTMLEPVPYPEHYPNLPKLDALKKCAQFIGKEQNFYRPPITVTFEDRQNHAGIWQRKSTCSGDDATGINDGSKNSTLMNYIPDAFNHGAEIFCESAVQRIEKRADGKFIVHFLWLAECRQAFKPYQTFSVIATNVFLGAGTLGSTEILLRSKQYGLPISNTIGQHFSGNGDILAFAYNCADTIHGIGYGTKTPEEMSPVGPCITGIIDVRDTEDVRDGYVIEEGSIPGAVGKLMSAAFHIGEKAIGVTTYDGLLETLKAKARQVETAIGGPYVGAMNNTQTVRSATPT
jgi:cholesterol oxidase